MWGEGGGGECVRCKVRRAGGGGAGFRAGG